MNYNIYAAVFAEELQPGQRIKLSAASDPVVVADTMTLPSGHILISHDQGLCVRGARELVRLEVER